VLKKRIYILAAMMMLGSGLLSAQSSRDNNDKLSSHHAISFNGGIKGNGTTEASVTTVSSKAGFTGGIEYGFWFSDEWLIGLSAGMVEASFDINFKNVETHAVVPILFGVKFYPLGLKMGTVGRPFISLFAGPYIGVATQSAALKPSTSTIHETVAGGELGAGIDLFIVKWLKLGPEVNYYLMGDFKQIAGETKNFSGFGFVFNLGFVL
jgi:hypothetical protein